jgi:hypothetical protein
MRSEARRQGHALSSSRVLQIKPPELRFCHQPAASKARYLRAARFGRPHSVAAAPVLIAALGLVSLAAADKWLE